MTKKDGWPEKHTQCQKQIFIFSQEHIDFPHWFEGAWVRG
jgi:hypothetical protein